MRFRVLAAVAVAYTAGAQLAFLVFDAHSIVVLFLPAGVTLSALLLRPRRDWPWILLTVAILELLIDMSHGLDGLYAMGFAAANTIEPLVGASLLRRAVPGRVDLAQRAHLLAFLAFGVIAGPAVGAVIGGTTIALDQDRGWLESFLPFWAGDATGALTVAGTVLAWRRPPLTRLASAVTATVAVTAIGFWPQHLPLFYLPLPLLFGLAFTQPPAVTMASGLAMTVTANTLTGAGHGPWAALDGPIELKTATLQLFLAVAVLGACFLAVGVAERDRAVSAAHQLQQALLPEVGPDRPGIRVSAGYRPADLTHHVGGDWYDVFAVPGDRIGFAVGDVVGHNLAAAAAMARLQSALRMLAQTAPDPAAALTALDRAGAVIEGAHMCTVAYADYHPATRHLRYACAGHPPPLLLTDTGGDFLWAGRSMPLTVEPGPRPLAEHTIPPGAHLILYTDGLIERRGETLHTSLARLATTATAITRRSHPDLARALLDRIPHDGPAIDDAVVLQVTFDSITEAVPNGLAS
ncbi:SpoIIE family protein phosphatase [Actinoplanes sp. NPDC049596]|uniref:PP2C family protein-serine/threonine phosphatase n=1 Tax=unclassified Actinoplanes TaxID=2626549 RepID=UPI00341E7E2B